MPRRHASCRRPPPSHFVRVAALQDASASRQKQDGSRYAVIEDTNIFSERLRQRPAVCCLPHALPPAARVGCCHAASPWPANSGAVQATAMRYGRCVTTLRKRSPAATPRRPPALFYKLAERQPRNTAAFALFSPRHATVRHERRRHQRHVVCELAVALIGCDG